MTAFIGRREFITLIGGAVAASPAVARAQQGERVRRIGMLIPYEQSDTEAQTQVAAFLEELQRLGWTDGRNVRVHTRWGGGDGRIGTSVKALVAFTAGCNPCAQYCRNCRAPEGDPHNPNCIRDRF